MEMIFIHQSRNFPIIQNVNPHHLYINKVREQFSRDNPAHQYAFMMEQVAYS